MNQNDAQGAGDTAHQDAAEADTLDNRSAQDRKAQLAMMLAREQDPEHQGRVARLDLALDRRTKAEEKLNRRKKKLNDNPANMDAAEADVTFAQKELRDLDLGIEELRGDFHMPNEESGDDPPPTILQWIELDESTAGVEFQDLPLLLAKAQAKPGEEGTTIAVRAIQFESELDLLVDRGLVPLTNPLSGEPHEYPHGYARKKAVIRTQDLHNVLARYFATGVRGKTEKEEAHAAPYKAKRSTWWDVSSDYIAGVMRSGQYTTAKELYKALEAKAGPDSPFDKGAGQISGSLYVREIAQSLSLKTIENRMRELRALAKK